MPTDRAADLLGRHGVWSTWGGVGGDQLIELAGEVAELGYDALWVNEGTAGREPLALLGALARATERLTLGAGVAAIQARDATAARAGARTLAEMSGGRFVMGLGVSHRSSAASRGHGYGPPLEEMRRYLDAYEAAPSGAGPTELEPPLILAALGPRMLELAATRTSGAFGYLVTSAWVREARRRLDDAAARAGRPRPVLVVSQAAVLGSGDVAREAARVVVGHHLGQPNYQRNMVRMGFTEDEARMPPPDRLVEALVATGDEAALRARLEEMLAAGADHVALIPIAPDGTQPDPAVIRACAPRLDPASARGYPR